MGFGVAGDGMVVGVELEQFGRCCFQFGHVDDEWQVCPLPTERASCLLISFI
jgi:hypothetical protein